MKGRKFWSLDVERKKIVPFYVFILEWYADERSGGRLLRCKTIYLASRRIHGSQRNKYRTQYQKTERASNGWLRASPSINTFLGGAKGSRVCRKKIIGKGAFRQVAKGTAEQLQGRLGTTTVAIRMLKSMILHILKLVISWKFHVGNIDSYSPCFEDPSHCFYITVSVIILTAVHTLDARAMLCTCATVKLHIISRTLVY